MGVELGQPHLFLKSSKLLLDLMPYAYVIGSVHKFNNGIDVSQIDYSDIILEEMCQIYLNEIKNLINTGDFDCVGHIDFIKRYSTNTYKNRVTLMIQQELLIEVFRLLISKGIGIEINTSGLRQAAKEAMPGLDALSYYCKLGGELLTIGSDAHYADDVGGDLELGIESAKQAGFNYLMVFNKRIPEYIRINNRNNLYYFGDKKII